MPNDALTWLAAIVSLFMSAFIQFFLTYSLSMMAFWILEISTIVFIVYSFEYFLGGQMFPLDIMPPAVQAVMKWLPFYYELFCPIAIFQGRLHGAEMLGALAIQCGWMLTMWAYVLYVEKPAKSRYLLTLFLFALGLMSKPMLVTLPFVLLLLDYWPLKRISDSAPSVPSS